MLNYMNDWIVVYCSCSMIML